MSTNGGDFSSTRRYSLDEISDRLDENNTKPKAKKEKKPKNKKNKKQNKVLRIILKVIKTIILTAVILGILAALIIAGIVAGLFLGLFGNDFKLTKEDLSIKFQNTEVYNADGKLVATLSGDEKRKVVSMKDMSEYVPKAYVAIEDERFYSHPGIDIKRTGAATLTYIIHKGNSNFGGSTITQQLVKNLTHDDDRTALRKIKEMAKALQVEKLISKDDILELYLNMIFVGGNAIHGVALGSEYYFSKDVSKLDLAESAFMAGINNSPNMYHPFSKDTEDIKLVKDRTKTVLAKMLELNMIDKAKYDEAVAEVNKGLAFKKGALSSGQVYSYITEEAIKEIKAQYKEMHPDLKDDMVDMYVYGGGLKIYTTEQPKIQKIVESEMSKKKYSYKSRKGQKSMATMTIIDWKTGEVVAMNGNLGKKSKNGIYNYAAHDQKQAGSTFKPIAVDAPAIQEGIITASTTFKDVATRYYNTPKGKPVYNEGGKASGKVYTVKQAVAKSLNTIHVQIMNKLKLQKSLKYVKQLGFSKLDPENEQPAIALGALTYGTNTLEMAAAYATFANDGEYIEPTFYKKVEDENGNVIMKPKQRKTQVFDEGVAYVMKDILTAPVLSGTATYCKISGMDVAAKTGTTNNSTNRWLCGFTQYYAAAVWFGHKTEEEVKWQGRGKYQNPAGEIWSEVMKEVHSKLKLKGKKFTVPGGVKKVKVCSKTGLKPAKGCPTTTTYFTAKNAPTKTCKGGHKTYKICKETGLLANKYCPKTTTMTEDDKVPTKTCTKHKEEEPKQDTTSDPPADDVYVDTGDTETTE